MLKKYLRRCRYRYLDLYTAAFARRSERTPSALWKIMGVGQLLFVFALLLHAGVVLGLVFVVLHLLDFSPMAKLNVDFVFKLIVTFGLASTILVKGGSRFYLRRLAKVVREADFQLCTECGYNLQGLESNNQCPECGSMLLKRDRLRRWWEEWFLLVDV